MISKTKEVRRGEVLLSRIRAKKGQLNLLERLPLTPEEQRKVKRMKKELEELEEQARFHINLLEGATV